MVTTRRAFRTLFEPTAVSSPPAPAPMATTAPARAPHSAPVRLRRTRAADLTAVKSEEGHAETVATAVEAVVKTETETHEVAAEPAGALAVRRPGAVKRKRTAHARPAAPATETASGADAMVALPEASQKKRVKQEPAAPTWSTPDRWQETYALLCAERDWLAAPVDTVGCEATGSSSVAEFADTAASRAFVPPAEYTPHELTVRREFATLVALLLSSQTKDGVTAAAVKTLQDLLPGGLTAESVVAASDETISKAIGSVGFWRRKTVYLRGVAERLLQREGEDRGRPPHLLEELVSFSGVGPKMAHLFLQSVGEGQGIGVDTHVHRIASRLGWTQPLTRSRSSPETTRAQLEAFLPRALWAHVNPLLVGLGQTVCTPTSPRCDLCAVAARQRAMGRVRGGPLCSAMLTVNQARSQHRVPVPWRSHADMLVHRRTEHAKEWKAALGPATTIELEVDSFIAQITAPTPKVEAKSERDAPRSPTSATSPLPSALDASTARTAKVKDESLDW